MGVDLLFNESDGLKVWVRYSSIRAAQHPEVNAFFLELRRILAVLQDTLDLLIICDVQIAPRRTPFHMNQFVFRVVELNDFISLLKFYK